MLSATTKLFFNEPKVESLFTNVIDFTIFLNCYRSFAFGRQLINIVITTITKNIKANIRLIAIII